MAGVVFTPWASILHGIRPLYQVKTGHYHQGLCA
jgi:hypothetical protein